MPKSKSKGAKANNKVANEEAPKEPSLAVEAVEAAEAIEAPKPENKQSLATFEPQSPTQAEIVASVLEKLGLASPDIKVEDKLDTLCIIFKQTLTENVKMKETVANLTGQLEKNDLTKSALQKLCDALKTQVNLKEEENNLKLQEETQKRIEISKTFESTMNELTKLIETHSAHNASLRDENMSMAKKLEELLRDFESRETKIDMLSEEFRLKTQLYEAQLSKSKVEKAELSADFSRERLEMQKEILETKKNIDILLTREENLKEQVELYAAQYESLSKGVIDKKNNMGNFKTQMDGMNKKLKVLETDTAIWREKFEESNDVVKKLNAAKAEADRDLESTRKKLAAMEKLNRALQSERSTLMAEIKAKASTE